MNTKVKVGLLGLEIAEITIFGLVSRGTKYSAGYDLYSNEECWLHPDEIMVISTGATWDVRLLTNGGLLPYGRICERSGLGIKGLNLGGGIIDADYRDIFRVICRNVGENVIRIGAGDRIAQLIIGVCFVGTDVVGTTRVGGFGSTGA